MKEKIELRTVGERIGGEIWIKGKWTQDEIIKNPDFEEIFASDDIIDDISEGRCRFVPGSDEGYKGYYHIGDYKGKGSFDITIVTLRQRCHGGCYQENEYGGHSYISYPNEKCRQCNFIKSGSD